MRRRPCAKRREASQKLLATAIRTVAKPCRAELDVARELQDDNHKRELLEEDTGNPLAHKQVLDKEKAVMWLDGDL